MLLIQTTAFWGKKIYMVKMPGLDLRVLKKKQKNFPLLDYESNTTSQYNLAVIVAIYHNMS